MLEMRKWSRSVVFEAANMQLAAKAWRGQLSLGRASFWPHIRRHIGTDDTRGDGQRGRWARRGRAGAAMRVESPQVKGLWCL